MSVIGYDGRIRPASTPFNAGTPNKLDPEAIGRISEAQPKFADLVMDTVSKIGGSVQRYGEAVAQREKKDASLASEEDLFSKKKDFRAEHRVIINDPKKTAEQKSAEVAALRNRFSLKPTGYEDIDRKNKMEFDSFAYSLASSAEDAADKLAVADRIAKFDGESSMHLKALEFECIASIDELVNTSEDLATAGGKLKKMFDNGRSQFRGGAPLTEEERVSFDEMSVETELSLLNKLAQRFLLVKANEKNKEVDVTCAAATAQANTAGDALAMCGGKIDAYVARGVLSPKEGRVKKNGVAMATTDRFVESSLIKSQAEATENQKAAYEFLAAGDSAGYNDAIRKLNEGILDSFAYLKGNIREDLREVVADIESDKSITDEEYKKSLIAIVKDHYEKKVEKVEKMESDQIATVRATRKAKEKEVGMAESKKLKNALKNGSVDGLSGMASAVYQKLSPTQAFIDAARAKGLYKPGAVDAYIAQTYGAVDPSKALGYVVSDFKMALASVDYNEEGLDNLTDVNVVLNDAIKFFGVDSPQYAEVLSFAKSVILSGKNDRGEEIKAFFKDQFFSDGKEDEWRQSLTPEQKASYFAALRYMKKVPSEQVPQELEKLKARIVEGNIFNAAVSAFTANAESAIETSKTKPTFNVTKESDGLQSKADTVIKMLEEGADYAIKQKQLELYKSGNVLDMSEDEKEEELQKYWRGVAKEFGVRYFGEDANSGVMASQVAIHLKTEEQHERRKNKEEEEDKKYRAGLEKELSDLKLPLDRRAYTSTVGIGGHSIEGTPHEIELGINLDGRTRLTVPEMRSILEQYREYKGLTPDEIRKAKIEKLEKELKGEK